MSESDVAREAELARLDERNPFSELARTEERNDRFHCMTCSDEGCPMTVVGVDSERALALCEDADGRRSSVEIALVDAVTPGTVLLVHAGTALAVLELA